MTEPNQHYRAIVQIDIWAPAKDQALSIANFITKSGIEQYNGHQFRPEGPSPEKHGNTLVLPVVERGANG